MLTQELSAIIRQELPLLAMTTADKRKYIVYQWNQTHGEPIDEDAVALFLCDENRGNLTGEQRTFAKERCAEFEHCTQITVYRILQCGEMMHRHLVPGPEEYCRIFLPQYAVPCSKQLSPCNGL